MGNSRYFVLVFGDPANNGDTLESERYEAEERYPDFSAKPGDLLLLYCTEGYPGHSKQFYGIGVAIHTSPTLIEYRGISFKEPIPLRRSDETFEPEDRKKMGNIRMSTYRAFEIDKQSFVRTVSGQKIEVAWD